MAILVLSQAYQLFCDWEWRYTCKANIMYLLSILRDLLSSMDEGWWTVPAALELFYCSCLFWQHTQWKGKPHMGDGVLTIICFRGNPVLVFFFLIRQNRTSKHARQVKQSLQCGRRTFSRRDAHTHKLHPTIHKKRERRVGIKHKGECYEDGT